MRETGIKSVKETGIRPIVIEEIRNFARKNGIKKVVLFGSRARGDHRKARKNLHRKTLISFLITYPLPIGKATAYWMM